MSSQLLFMPAVLLDLLSRAGAVGGFSAIQKQEKGQTGLLLSLTVSMLRRYLCPLWEWQDSCSWLCLVMKLACMLWAAIPVWRQHMLLISLL